MNPIFYHRKSPTSFRHPQTIDVSSKLNLYQADIVISLDDNNDLNLIKHKSKSSIYNISVNESVDIMMDMLCRMIFRGRMDMFQEELKIELCEVINNILKKKGGNSNENAI